VSAEIVNLRRARKAKQRAADSEAAAANRLQFGKSKAARDLDAAVNDQEKRRHEAHRRDLPSLGATRDISTDPPSRDDADAS
jgi:Domain of unknown function (DUF4169)